MPLPSLRPEFPALAVQPHELEAIRTALHGLDARELVMMRNANHARLLNQETAQGDLRGLMLGVTLLGQELKRRRDS